MRACGRSNRNADGPGRRPRKKPYNRAMDAEPQGSVLVGVVMGSRNDYAVMRGTVEVLKEFGVAHEVRVVSAHRTPDLLFEYAHTAAGRRLAGIISGGGGAARLPGVIAAETAVPGPARPIPTP